MKLNYVQIGGIILIVIGFIISYLFTEIDLKMIPAILIGFGAGLTVFKKGKAS